MKKQKKQSFLTSIITILVIILIMMVGSIIYEEKINMNNQELKDTIAPVEKDDKIEDKEEDKVEVEENLDEDKSEEEYVGEEEQEDKDNGENTTKSIDEKAIDLAKKEWGIDETVTFNLEKKNGAKYYVAVKREATVVQWYEVDTETWEISEY